MNRFYLPFRFFGLALLTFVPALPVRAVTPMEYYNSLVAGGSETGYRDGSFAAARFNDPRGICFDNSGEKLYVADSENHLIRVVDLAHHNDVETLAGTGVRGQGDGVFEKATFNSPTRILSIPDNRLVVYDAGSSLFRILDLGTRSVTTVSGSVLIWDMIYHPQDDSLYFSQRNTKSLGRLDMKTGVYSTVFSQNSQLPTPYALCLDGDKLYVADQNLPTIYEMSLGDGKSQDKKEVALKEVGQGDQVREMTVSDGVLYVLQAGKDPLVKLASTKSVPVILPMRWGYFINDESSGFPPFMNLPQNQWIGMASSPLEPRKLYISKLSIAPHAIISVKDYSFDKNWIANPGNSGPEGLTDFDYPALKSPGIYRILLVGDSRTCAAARYEAGQKTPDPESDTLRTDTFPKQLEVFLNSEAALRDVNTHYEVLTLSRPDEALSSYAYDEVPPLAKKYNVDLVLGLLGSTGYQDYYTRVVKGGGLPSRSNDPSYSKKPLAERVPPGAAMDLYRQFLKKWPTVDNENSLPSDGKLLVDGDPAVRADLMEMAEPRLTLLSERLAELKSAEGIPPKLVFFYIPARTFANDLSSSFWQDLCSQNHFSFLNLSETFDALKTTYYPTSQDGKSPDYTACGAELIGDILEQSLVENKYIPFETIKK